MAMQWQLNDGRTLEQLKHGEKCFSVCLILEFVGISKITTETIPVILKRYEIFKATLDKGLGSEERDQVAEVVRDFLSLSVNVIDETESQFFKNVRRFAHKSAELPKGYKRS